jgi:hypothetical protein
MSSGKNSRAVRSARAAVVTKRSTPWGMIAAILVVVLFAGGIFGYYVVQNNAKQAKAAALAQWTPSDTNKDPSLKIPGIVTQQYAGANHVQLIQVGGAYYVRDGHHRVSVTRALGQDSIEAEVSVWTND